jgi:GNAT superfamily N-acetyltransferase
VSENLRIRRARIEDAPGLTALTMRSKAYWGYDERFMAAATADLTFKPAMYLPDFHVYILENNTEWVGFCGLIPENDERVELYDLFVEPKYIGKGYGKQLWDHAVRVAAGLGFRALVLTADPNARPFYERQGAVFIRERPSPVPGDRTNPLMEYRLRD